MTGASSASIKLAYNITSSTTGIFTDPAKVYLDKSKQDGSEETSQLKLHGQAALASAKSTNRLAVGAFKGGMVDVPLALAEGFRNAPRLWGEDVKEQQEINGWKSGAAVAGKVRTGHVSVSKKKMGAFILIYLITSPLHMVCTMA